MPRLAFFGSSRFSIIVLDELKKSGYTSSLIVTTPDKPKGRKLVLTPTPVKEWAIKEGIPFLDSAKLDEKLLGKLKIVNCKLFIVASYGKIIPKPIIKLPEYRSLNIHPSLLPRYRGASPLQSAILEDAKDTGVTIMRMDELMDHGPIVAQEKINIGEWPVYEEFEDVMARIGGQLLVKTIPAWISGKIKEKEQDHSKATFTRKVEKEDGLIDLNSDPYLNFRKVQAYHEWPQAFFFVKHAGKEMRVKVIDASYRDGKFTPERVVPEGSKEMSFADFLKGYGKSHTEA
ncbi:MAG: methionyl-tRNA formyltransferase [Candidatus Taylorbacteria bacterium]|nr:methionyl-tRNA formyltransferase [Candidatus Taylorbacteria bacterium]